MSDPIETQFVVAFYNNALTPGSKWLKQGYRHVVTYQPLGRDSGSKQFEWISEQRNGLRITRSKIKLSHSDLPRFLKERNVKGGVTVYEIEQRTPKICWPWVYQPGGVGASKATIGISAWGIWTPWDLARYAQIGNHRLAVKELRYEKLRRSSLAVISATAIAFFMANDFDMPTFSRQIEASDVSIYQMNSIPKAYAPPIPKLKP